MKKVMFLIPILIFSLTSCVDSNSVSSNSKSNKIVNLTKDNYSQYINVDTKTSTSYSGVWSNTTYQYVLYSTYNALFHNCVIIYSFANGSKETNGREYTLSLNIYGDGESTTITITDRYYLQSSNYWIFTVLSAYGTIEFFTES